MKSTFAIITFLSSSIASLAAPSAFAAGELTCQNGQQVLLAREGKHVGNGPTLHGFRIEGEKNTSEGEKVFQAMLESSGLCKDLSLYIRLGDNRILLCEGEFFALKAIYGQVILSKGAIVALTEKIAPAAGWNCKHLSN